MEDKNKLLEYRKKIDKIDNEIISSFEKRLEVSLEIGRYKKKNKLPITSVEREEEVINNALLLLKNESFEGLTRDFMKFLIESSKKAQSSI